MAGMKKVFSRAYVVLMAVLLYAPLAILIVCSFNASKARTVWGGFTLHWYKELFANEDVLAAVRTSLMLTLLAALLATLIGTMACIAMTAMKKRWRGILQSVANIPMLNADIVTGIAIMLLFVHFLTLGFTSMLIAHVTLGIPYVILNVMPRLQQMNISTYEAALDLGAGPGYSFFHVVLPEIIPGIMAGFFFAITMSLDDFVVTYFTKGAGINTISTMLYQQLRRGINPEMYALSALLLLVILVLMGLGNRMSAMQEADD